jgi:hypothetical protein
MTPATPVTREGPTWILGSLRENLEVLLQTQLKRPFGKAEILTPIRCAVEGVGTIPKHPRDYEGTKSKTK